MKEGPDRLIAKPEVKIVHVFSREENMIWVSMRLLAGDFETNTIRVTIPEGTTVVGIAKIL